MKNSYFAKISKTLNILCVEDDETILDSYVSLFSPLFQKVYFAKNGKEGLECFKNEKIDIILTDNMMPICNGLEMSKAIREIDASVPIILVTALESIETLREAIELQISSFLKKPFTSTELFRTFHLVSKSVIADRCMMKEQEEQILYSQYQENLTFEKEQTIVKNDLQESKKLLHLSCDVFYQPKDILSGDSYVIKKINAENYLIFLVDGMGKGISASVSAMLSSAFVNYHIDMLTKEDKAFSLPQLLIDLQEFIGPNLLEYEVISASFLYFDKTKMQMEYAIFSMPPVLYMFDSSQVLKLKSNNTPFTSYSKNFQIDTLDIKPLQKMLIYSDGLNENSVDGSQELYMQYLQKDFRTSKNIQEFQSKLEAVCTSQDDDTTYIYIGLQGDF
ncbi:response regulator [Sulfurimonas paralvinellae]|nr:response regulator [Sulfurimonas paralvinellae]